MRDREIERKKEGDTSIYCSTYLCIHWLILVCALTEPTTVVYQGDALTNWATWPGWEYIFHRWCCCCPRITFWETLFFSLQSSFAGFSSSAPHDDLLEWAGTSAKVCAGLWSWMVSDQRRNENSRQTRHCLGVQSLETYLYFLVKNNSKIPIPNTFLYPKRAFMYSEFYPEVPAFIKSVFSN